MQLWTGSNTGKPVTAVADRALYSGIEGRGSYVFEHGSMLEAAMSDANHLSIMDGEVLHHGAHITVDGSEEWVIPSGVQGAKRSHIAVIRYTSEKDGGTIVERANPVVLSGEPALEGDPQDPQIETESILDGAVVSDMPLYRVVTDGLAVGEPERLFETIPSIEALVGTIGGKADKDHTHTAADVGALPLTGGTMSGPIAFANNVPIQGVNSKGQVPGASFEARTSDDRVTLGYASYADKLGNTSIYGNAIMMQSRGNVNVYLDNGSMYLKGRIVWGGAVIYANDAGSAGTVTLTEDAANFQIADIYYKTSDGVYGMTRVYMPNGKTANLTAVMYKHYSANDAVYCKVRDVVISGTSIYTTGYEGESSTTSVNSCSTYNVAGIILITRVVGYAY